jgi:RNA polymerase sigma-70 factor (ECF subfamily)
VDRYRRFEVLYEAHRRPLLAYALRRLVLDDAKDVVADTFLVTWRRLEEVPEDALPWLFGVARKVISTKLRAQKRQQSLRARLESTPSEHADNDPATEWHDRNRLAAAFASLSELDREVLMLVAWDGLDIRRAAAALGCAPASFSVRLHRARRRLARNLRTSSSPNPRGKNIPRTKEPRMEDAP